MDTDKSSAPAHHPEVAAGDPFAHAGRECSFCYGAGVHVIEVEDFDGEIVEETVPCRRCNA